MINGKIKKIYHISDIHIPNNIERHEEYKNVFNRLITKIDSSGIVVICGDLYHDKTNLKPEAISLAQFLLEEITKVTEVIIIDGNHDININNDKIKNFKTKKYI